MNEGLEHRIARMYSAIGEMSASWDRNALRVTPIVDEKSVGWMLDFKGGTSDEQLSNRVFTAIYNIAHLRDHLRRWARANGKDESRVDAVRRQTSALRIITDLSDSDKHEGSRRDGGQSGLAPHLRNVTQALQTRGPGSSFAFSLRDGSVSTTGDLGLVIDAEVVDKDGNVLGSLAKLSEEALKAWESLLVEFGIQT